ncbi:ankyrin repeat-containing domain protein [Aspergillus keveii]|uniref:Ankyrin repeat-containing domain protein n=1 Tax=Aspergillus keveii TaxID=714993 RepID=A0ABR4GDU2_9EURO
MPGNPQRRQSLATIPPELQLAIIEYLDAQGKAALLDSDLLSPNLIICANKLDEYDWYGHTLLHAAAQRNYTKAAKLLIAAGASPSSESEADWDGGATPLVLASKNGHLPILHILLDHGAKPEECSHSDVSCLHHACEEGHTHIVEALLDHDADANSLAFDIASPFHVAVAGRHADVVRILLANGAKVNALRRRVSGGITALQTAAANVDVECVQLLLDAGAIATYEPAPEDPGWFIRPPSLHDICAGPHYTAAWTWIEHGSRTSPAPALVWKEGEKEAYAEILRLLCEAGGDVSAELAGHEGTTPLHLAVVVRNCEAVKVLLSEGVNVSARNSKGQSAISFARLLGYEDVAEPLERALVARPEKRRMPIVGPKPTVEVVEIPARDCEVLS